MRRTPIEDVKQNIDMFFALCVRKPIKDKNHSVHEKLFFTTKKSVCGFLDSFELTRSSDFIFGDPTNHNFYFWKISKLFHDIDFFLDFEHHKIIKFPKFGQNLPKNQNF